jgi:hypothetical protein
MGIMQDKIKPFGSPLVDVTGEQVQTMGLISLPITCGTSPRQSTVMVDFLVVDRPLAYIMIIGRPALNKLKAITSTYHLMMKFPTNDGIRELKGDHVVVQKCYNISLKRVMGSGFLSVNVVNSTREVEVKGEPAKESEEVIVRDGKVLKIGSRLASKILEGIVNFLPKHGSFHLDTRRHAGNRSQDYSSLLEYQPQIKPGKAETKEVHL